MHISKYSAKGAPASGVFGFPDKFCAHRRPRGSYLGWHFSQQSGQHNYQGPHMDSSQRFCSVCGKTLKILPSRYYCDVCDRYFGFSTQVESAEIRTLQVSDSLTYPQIQLAKLNCFQSVMSDPCKCGNRLFDTYKQIPIVYICARCKKIHTKSPRVEIK